MRKKKLTLLTAIFLTIIYTCARPLVIEPPNIMPEIKEPPREEILSLKEQEREEAAKEILSKGETVFEIVFDREVIDPVISLKPEEKEEVLPPKIEPEIKPPILEKQEKKEILSPKDVLRPGEELLFGIRYLGMRIGTGTLKIEGIVPLRDQLSYHLVSMAKSTGIFSLIYKVNERLESFMDLSGLYSLRFELHSSGKKPRSFVTIYDQKKQVAYHEGRKIPIPPNSHDPISAFYHLRLHNLKVGEEVIIDVNTGKENHKIGVKVLGNKKVETQAGEFDCLILEPYFKDKDDPQKRRLRIYITNDNRKIPVLITSKLPFGQVVLSLEETKGV